MSEFRYADNALNRGEDGFDNCRARTTTRFFIRTRDLKKVSEGR
jgi:hypothetical protein